MTCADDIYIEIDTSIFMFIEQEGLSVCRVSFAPILLVIPLDRLLLAWATPLVGERLFGCVAR
jgi:hypothetical protein